MDKYSCPNNCSNIYLEWKFQEMQWLGTLPCPLCKYPMNKVQELNADQRTELLAAKRPAATSPIKFGQGYDSSFQFRGPETGGPNPFSQQEPPTRAVSQVNRRLVPQKSYPNLPPGSTRELRDRVHGGKRPGKMSTYKPGATQELRDRVRGGKQPDQARTFEPGATQQLRDRLTSSLTPNTTVEKQAANNQPGSDRTSGVEQSRWNPYHPQNPRKRRYENYPPRTNESTPLKNARRKNAIPDSWCLLDHLKGHWTEDCDPTVGAIKGYDAIVRSSKISQNLYVIMREHQGPLEYPPKDLQSLFRFLIRANTYLSSFPSFEAKRDSIFNTLRCVLKAAKVDPELVRRFEQICARFNIITQSLVEVCSRTYDQSIRGFIEGPLKEQLGQPELSHLEVREKLFTSAQTPPLRQEDCKKSRLELVFRIEKIECERRKLAKELLSWFSAQSLLVEEKPWIKSTFYLPGAIQLQANLNGPDFRVVKWPTDAEIDRLVREMYAKLSTESSIHSDLAGMWEEIGIKSGTAPVSADPGSSEHPRPTESVTSIAKKSNQPDLTERSVDTTAKATPTKAMEITASKPKEPEKDSASTDVEMTGVDEVAGLGTTPLNEEILYEDDGEPYHIEC